MAYGIPDGIRRRPNNRSAQLQPIRTLFGSATCKQGRGRNCNVEVFRRYEKEYFFAYPEDYAQSGLEWVRNRLAPRSRHPAFEVVFVYCQNEGSLDIYAPRNTTEVTVLQQIFAKAILRMDDLAECGGDNRVYFLDPELPRFGGHLILWEKGVPDAKESPPIPAGVSAADDRIGPCRSDTGGAGARV